jgi:ABC-2 type transport system permease protein/oleandomycin transport system permease protein
MTATVAQHHPSRVRLAISDGRAVTWRNLRGMTRIPEVVMFSTIQPIIFVLTFRYVFGGAIKIPNVRYVDFLMPGVFVQTVAFGAMNTAVGLAEDLRSGMLDRFRSLPIARSAVLAGRTIADLLRNVLVVTMMVGVGFLVGFRVHTNALAFLGALVVLVYFSFAMSWVFALIGLSMPNAEAAQAASFPVLALLVFASSAFAPTNTMPGWLRVYTEHQPVSDTAEALRALVLGGPTTSAVLSALAWSTGILLVFVPLAVRSYRRAAR